MRLLRLIWILIFFIECGWLCAQDSLTIISYNVENLFDYTHDSLKNDSSFLPNGMHHWNYYRYQTKLDHIAQVITNISGWESAELVGLCEVENAHCLRDLCYRLKRFHYNYIHYESADERGIDVALLYDSTKVNVLNSKPIHVNLNGDNTRDILYVSAQIEQQDTMHLLVCHLPSQLGGKLQTDWKRKITKATIQQQIDSILYVSPKALIVVMGDMNAEPKDDLHRMKNMLWGNQVIGEGTHKYQGIWSYLDQFYISESLINKANVQVFFAEWLLEEDTKYLGYQPKRCYSGYRYKGGYSDHLPILLRLAQ
jgi:endonuclease/exonuclease/phosphatase family metal-dependent hydrolase